MQLATTFIVAYGTIFIFLLISLFIKDVSVTSVITSDLQGWLANFYLAPCKVVSGHDD